MITTVENGECEKTSKAHSPSPAKDAGTDVKRSVRCMKKSCCSNELTRYAGNVPASINGG
jgi:hypothetical protein